MGELQSGGVAVWGSRGVWQLQKDKQSSGASKIQVHRNCVRQLLSKTVKEVKTKRNRQIAEVNPTRFALFPIFFAGVGYVPRHYVADVLIEKVTMIPQIPVVSSH